MASTLLVLTTVVMVFHYLTQLIHLFLAVQTATLNQQQQT
jgi:hypothetical protein